jgi:uncharacterized membrane protein YgcG
MGGANVRCGMSSRPETSDHRTRCARVFLAGTGAALVALCVLTYCSSPVLAAAKQRSGAVRLDQSYRIDRPDSSSRAQYGPVPVPPYPPPRPSPPPPPPPPTPPTTPPGSGTGSGGTGGKGGTAPFTPPSSGQSGGQSGGTSGASGASGSAGASQGQSSGLPFTGLSLVFPVLVGGALVGVGAFLRRRGRASSD